MVSRSGQRRRLQRASSLRRGRRVGRRSKSGRKVVASSRSPTARPSHPHLHRCIVGHLRSCRDNRPGWPIHIDCSCSTSAEPRRTRDSRFVGTPCSRRDPHKFGPRYTRPKAVRMLTREPLLQDSPRRIRRRRPRAGEPRSKTSSPCAHSEAQQSAAQRASPRVCRRPRRAARNRIARPPS
jgi:hypothetical protein